MIDGEVTGTISTEGHAHSCQDQSQYHPFVPRSSGSDYNPLVTHSRRTLVLPLSFGLLAGCIHYDLRGEERCNGRDDDRDGVIDEDFPDIDEDGIADCVDTEACDGRDNDGDGLIDEGFPDTDGDGILDCLDVEDCDGVDNDGDGQVDEGALDADLDGTPDCLDTQCELAVAGAGSVDSRTCPGQTPGPDPWSGITALQTNTSGEIRDCADVPTIAVVKDTNSDGKLGVGDHPSWAYVTHSGRATNLPADNLVLSTWGYEDVVIDGPFQVLGSPSFIDVTGDGQAEVLVLLPGGRLHALDASGEMQWTSPVEMGVQRNWPSPLDGNGDGVVDLLAGTRVYDGSNGEILWHGLGSGNGIVVDLDGSSPNEIVVDGAAFSVNGWMLWDTGYGGMSSHAPTQADADDAPEIWSFTGDIALIVQANGNASLLSGSTSGLTHEPTIADFDGDGLPEAVRAGSALAIATELDGTVRWTAPVQDYSSNAAPSGYDLNGDGAYEVLYADHEAFYIFDGRTGAVLYTDPDHVSWTGQEYPTVADIDLDGSVEILVCNSSIDPDEPRSGIVIYDQPNGSWVPGTRGWPIANWQVTNIDEYGVPDLTARPWLDHNVFRAGPPHPDAPRFDLVVEIVDSCVASCDPGGLVRLEVQVSNIGTRDYLDPVPVAVWSLDGDDRELLTTLAVSPADAGEVLASTTIELSIDDVGPDGVLIAAGDVGTGLLPKECDDANNVVVWTADVCAD